MINEIRRLVGKMCHGDGWQIWKALSVMVKSDCELAA